MENAQASAGKTNAELARKAWVEACDFHPLSDRETLEKVVALTAQHENPVVILDLDSTLYEVKPRTHRILLEWSTSEEALEHGALLSAFQSLALSHVGYSIQDTFKYLDLCHEENAKAVEAVKRFWDSRFFTNDYLPYDHAYPGSPEFAWKLHNQGAHLVYLTGRDEPGMGRATRENLLRDGFPLNLPRTTVMLKKERKIDDLLHKLEAAQILKDFGTVVASFENEPKNVVSLSEIFPQAMHVFVDTVCGNHPAPVRGGLYRIEGYPTLE